MSGAGPVSAAEAPGIIVAGSVNHDRLWQLDAPLTAGGRIGWRNRLPTLGGGATYTGMRLAELGHRVTLLSTLSRDDRGLAAGRLLAAAGIGTTLIHRTEAPSRVAEILLGADGERTILFPPGPRPVPEGRFTGARAAYVNAARLGPALRDSLDGAPLVLTQLPLGPADPRPADLAVTSRDDMQADGPAAIRARAEALCGPRLRAVVVTDGPGPVQVIEGDSARLVAPPPRVEVSNSTGAGDSFAAALLDGLLGGAPPTEAAARAAQLTADWLRRRPVYRLDAPS